MRRIAIARAVASHGADVLKINSPNLPSVPPFVIDTGHGKRSALLDLDNADDAQTLRGLAGSAGNNSRKPFTALLQMKEPLTALG